MGLSVRVIYHIEQLNRFHRIVLEKVDGFQIMVLSFACYISMINQKY